jgi:hypothetical protein
MYAPATASAAPRTPHHQARRPAGRRCEQSPIDRPGYGNAKLDVLTYARCVGAVGTSSPAWPPDHRAVTAVDEIALDFSSALTVESVRVGGAAATASRRGADLVVPARVAADERVTLVVAYHGVPRTVPMPSGRGDFGEGLGLRADADGEAWTMQEPYGGHTWYPVNDHPSDEAIYDIAVTVPKGWAAIAQGGLTGVTPGPDGDTYRWSSDAPVASYLATGRGPVHQAHRRRAARPSHHVLDPHGQGRIRRAAPRHSAVAGLAGGAVRAVPFPTAGVMVDSGSAMETADGHVRRAAGESGGRRPDPCGRSSLHEYAHQWFGDAVTRRLDRPVAQARAGPCTPNGCGPSTRAGPLTRSGSSWPGARIPSPDR